MNVRTPADIALLARERRRQLRVSQHELARRIGASRQWVQNLEQGRPGLELGLTLRALGALGLSFDAREAATGITPAVDPAGRRGLSLRGAATVTGHPTTTAPAPQAGPRARTHGSGASEHRKRSSDGGTPRPAAGATGGAAAPPPTNRRPARGSALETRASTTPSAARPLLLFDLDSIVSATRSRVTTRAARTPGAVPPRTRD